MNNQNNNTLTYTKVGDYYIPNLALDDQPDKEVGVYGRMREQYLKEHHPVSSAVFFGRASRMSRRMPVRSSRRTELTSLFHPRNEYIHS